MIKLHKAVMGAAALVLAAAFAFGASGCSKATRNAERIKSEETTPDIWAVYVGGNNFGNCKITYNYYQYSKGYSGGMLRETTEYNQKVLIFDGKTEYVETRTWTEGQFGKFSLDTKVVETAVYSQRVEQGGGTVTYRYKRNAAGKWDRSIKSGNVAQEECHDIFGDIDKVYGDYVFSEERKGYVRESDNDGEYYVIKFRDGKLAGIWREINDEEYGGAIKTTVYDIVFSYDAQTLTLPAEYDRA